MQYPTPPTSIGVINATTDDLWPQLHELFPPQTLWRQNMRIYPSFTCYYGGRPSAQTGFGVESSTTATPRKLLRDTPVSLKVTELTWTLTSSSPHCSPMTDGAAGQSKGSIQGCDGQRRIGSAQKLLGGVLGARRGSQKVREGETVIPENKSSK